MGFVRKIIRQLPGVDATWEREQLFLKLSGKRVYAQANEKSKV